MMTKMLKFISICYLFFQIPNLANCQNQFDKLNDEEIIKIMYHIIGKFDFQERYALHEQKKKYYLEDSLNSLFERLQPNVVMVDTNYRKVFLYLLEKKYLYLVNIIKNKDDFYLANATIWSGVGTYMQFALNVFSMKKIPNNYNYTYSKYLNAISDIVCANQIIKETSKYRLVDEGHKIIHKKCMKNIPKNCDD